jgi:hypothetical protein
MNRKKMRRCAYLCLSVGVLFIACAFGQRDYTPPTGSWEHRTPQQSKLDGAKLKEAIDFAIASESKVPRDLQLAHLQTFGREPYGEPIGQFKERGDATGIIIRNGYIVAEWGDPGRVDMTFSVTKSFLSATVGLAYDRKLIRSLQDKAGDYAAPVQPYRPGEKFDSP